MTIVWRTRGWRLRRGEAPVGPRNVLGGALLVGLLLTPSLAWAGALATVAQDAAKALGPLPPSVFVAAAPLVSDEPVTRGDDLAVRIAVLLAGKIGASAHVLPQAVRLETAESLAGRAGALVFVATEIAAGDLRTTVDVYPSMANAWDRIRHPLPAPKGHAYANAKLDAEVRSFLTPLMLELATVRRARHEEGDVLAAACGDADGDGGNEMVLVSRRRVVMGRVRGGSFVAERTAEWAGFGPPLPVPMREPLGGAAVSLGAVDVGTTDRGGFSLSSDLRVHASLAGIPAQNGADVVCLLPQPLAGAFDGAPVECPVVRYPRPAMTVPSPRFDAFAAASFADAQGQDRSVVAVREPSGRLKVRVEELVTSLDGPFGAQLAVGDLDQDGVAEVVTTQQGGDDAVNVMSISPSGDVRSRLHLAAPAGVRALALCPPEARGEPALLAVVGSEVWLVHPGVPLVAAAETKPRAR